MTKAEIIEMIVEIRTAEGHPFPAELAKGLNREPKYYLAAMLDYWTAPAQDKEAAKKALAAADSRAHKY